MMIYVWQVPTLIFLYALYAGHFAIIWVGLCALRFWLWLWLLEHSATPAEAV